MKKVAVVSALFFTDKIHIPETITKLKEWDYILFTNDKEKITDKNAIWDIREIQPYRNDYKYGLKHIKWMTHLYLPEYETIIWTDCFFIPNHEKINEMNEIIDHIHNYPCTPIFMRAEKSKNVNENIDWCYNHNLTDLKMKKRSKLYLKNKGFEIENDHSMYSSSVVIKSNQNEKLKQMSEELFLLINNICFQDQYWLPYLFKKHSLNCNVITDKNIFLEPKTKMINKNDYFKHIKIVYICNNTIYHSEIVPSIIEKYQSIIRDEDHSDKEYKIYLSFCLDPYLEGFVTYIKNKFPEVILSIPEYYDYKIDCSVCPEGKSGLINDEYHFYISHIIHDYQQSNIFYLTPLCKQIPDCENNYICCDVMPFYKRKCMNNNIPVFIVQCNIDLYPYDYNLLETILETKFKQLYVIKLFVNEDLDPKFNKYGDKLFIKKNLNFIEYHREMLDGYCILPLTSKETTPIYYETVHTSSINYGLGFDFHFMIDKDLNDIYHLEKTFVYDGKKNIVDAFRKSLEFFYNRV